MRTVLSPKLVKAASKVGKWHFLKALLKPFYYAYKKHIIKNRNTIFLKHGIEVLKDFDSVMNEAGIKYTLTGGSMLGAVREHGFIKHDLDIDTAIWAKEGPDRVRKILEKHGFELYHSFTLNDGNTAREDTFRKYRVPIDIFYIFEDSVQYHCDFQPYGDATSWLDSMSKYGHVKCRRVEIPFSDSIIRMPFETIEINVTSNYNEWLGKRYGKDYMIPNPGWSNGKNSYIKEWIGMNPVFFGTL